MDAELDPARRYLQPAHRSVPRGVQGTVCLAVQGWEERLDGFVTYSTSLCGRSVTDRGLPHSATVTCPSCAGLRPQYEQALAKDAEAAPPVRDRVAARRDPRYAAVLAEIAGFGWPAGNPMVPGSWADAMATRVMTAIRAEEA